MYIKHCYLWDGESELFVPGIPCAIVCIGEKVMDPHAAIDDDKRLVKGCTRTGQCQFLYRDGDGFKKIVLDKLRI